MESDVGASSEGLLTSDSATELIDPGEVGNTELLDDSDSIESFTLNTDEM